MEGMNERRLKIIAAVVEGYVREGEPVGSKAIAVDIGVSPATVRSEMAILERLGYLEQPHTSAGRIPTIEGFRLYVEEILTPPTLPEAERERLDTMLAERGTLTESTMLESATTALAQLTQCAVIAQNITPKFSVIAKAEVIPTGKRLYVILLITSEGSIKNKTCRLEFDLTHEQLAVFKAYLQENLEGLSLHDLSEDMLEKMTTAMGAYMMTLSPLVHGICELSRDVKKNALLLCGEGNLFSYEELDRHEIVSFLEHKSELTQLLADSMSGLRVVFGADNKDGAESFAIGNSSMIVSPYQREGHTVGSLGVIGPMRLDYAKVIPYIEYFSQKMTELIADEGEGIPEEKG